MNKVVLMGRTTRDVEVRYSGETAVARMTLAVDRRIKKEPEGQQADFVSCVAFGKTAEFLSKYGIKGTKFAISGRIQTCFHTEFGIFHALNALDVVLCQDSGRTTDRKLEVDYFTILLI